MSSTKPYGFKKITLHYTRYFSLWCATSGLGAPISAYVGNQNQPKHSKQFISTNVQADMVPNFRNNSNLVNNFLAIK